MAYFVPRVQIEQEFSQVPTFTENPQSALIFGPQYNLARYSIAGEKPNTIVLESVSPSTNVNYYVGSQRTYNFQNVAAGSVVDLSYLKVYLSSLRADYYTTVGQVNKVSGQANQIQANHSGNLLTFKTGFNHTRSAGFGSRDVQAGDVILLQDAATSPTNTLQTTVVAVLNSITPSAVGSATKITGSANITVATQGTYTGTQNLTYRIICTSGGAWGSATVKVISDGTDSSGPFVVDQGGSNWYDLGTLGVQFQFSAVTPNTDILTTGDEYHVSVTAAAPDRYDILQLANNVSWNNVFINKMSLVQNDVLIPEVRDLNANTLNWTATSTSVTLNSGINVTDTSLFTGSGSNIVYTSLPVSYAQVFVERRDLVTTNSSAIAGISDISTVPTVLGTIHPDNTLAQGVYNALLNSASTTVYYCGVPTNDLAGYLKVLELAKKNNIYYGLVPLTFESDVQTAVVAHVNAMSASSQAKWRVCWLSEQVQDTALLYGDAKPSTSTVNANQPWRAYVSANPGDNTKFNYVTIGYNNGSNQIDPDAKLLTDGIRAGDKLNYNFRLDVLGNVIHDSATITAVTSENTLITDFDWGSAQTNPFKIEIERVYTSAEKATNFAASVNAFDSRRVRIVFPDTFKSGTTTQSGYLLAACLAGLRSGVVPHQSLTNIEVLGPTDLSRVVNDFTEDDLDQIAAQGAWIVTQNAIGSSAYTRHQLTSDSSSLNFSEDSITANVDSISYGLQAALAPFIGKYNINAGSLLKVRAAIDNELSSRMTSTTTESAGPQLLGYTIVSVAQDPTFKDKILVTVQLQVPAPMNYITITLSI